MQVKEHFVFQNLGKNKLETFARVRMVDFMRIVYLHSQAIYLRAIQVSYNNQ